MMSNSQTYTPPQIELLTSHYERGGCKNFFKNHTKATKFQHLLIQPQPLP
jgi:hypothetical protein